MRRKNATFVYLPVIHLWARLARQQSSSTEHSEGFQPCKPSLEQAPCWFVRLDDWLDEKLQG